MARRLHRRRRSTNPVFVEPSRTTPSDPDFVYHATNVENLYGIAEHGVETHPPWHGTDQDEWPDGSTQKRSYWANRADVVWAFAPEEGPAVIIRTPKTAQFKRESTGDIYTTKKVPAKAVEVLTEDGWKPLDAVRSSNPPMRYVVVPVDTDGDDRDDVAFVLQGYPLHRDDALRTVAHAVHVDDMVNQADTRVFRAKHEAERYAAQMAPRTRFLD